MQPILRRNPGRRTAITSTLDKIRQLLLQCRRYFPLNAWLITHIGHDRTTGLPGPECGGVKLDLDGPIDTNDLKGIVGCQPGRIGNQPDRLECADDAVLKLEQGPRAVRALVAVAQAIKRPDTVDPVLRQPEHDVDIMDGG